jgi:aspartate/methionine/tyrosine aminotransferase
MAGSRAWASHRRAAGRTFYVWGKVGRLPPPLDDGMGFFRAALDKQVIVVPGEFFDVQPRASAAASAPPAFRARALLVRPRDGSLETGVGRSKR